MSIVLAALLALTTFNHVAYALEHPQDVQYGVRNSLGHGMDTAKIIPAGEGYIAVSHTGCSPCHVEVETSPDLHTWTYRATLDSGSQPTIARIGKSYVVADEVSDGHKSWLHFLRYPSRSALLRARPSREFDAPHTLTPPDGGNEGTPSIISADRHEIAVGFHYNTGVDREARGILRDFSSWHAHALPKVDAALTAAGAQGKHGDRDEITYQGTRFTIYEGQTVFSQGFSDWRIYLYSRGKAEQLNIPGCESVGNPSMTRIGSELVVALFVFSQGCSHAGTMIYTQTLEGT